MDENSRDYKADDADSDVRASRSDLTTDNAERSNRKSHDEIEDPDQFVKYIGRKWRVFWTSLDPNRVIAGFTIVIALTGIAYTLFAGLQWSEMRNATTAATRAANTAARQLELTERPWVFVKGAKVVSPLTFDKDGAHVTFEVVVRNSGLSPAVNVEIEPRLYLLSKSKNNSIDALCDAASYVGEALHGMMLPPDTDSQPKMITVGLGTQELAADPGYRHSGILAITPFICVLYRPSFRDGGPGYSTSVQYWLWPTIWPKRTPVTPSNNLPLYSAGFFRESAH